MLSGLTIANVVGVPAGTFLGQNFGWHIAFLIVALIFGLAAIMIAFFVPAHPGDPTRTLRSELRVFRIPQVWLTLGIGAIGFGGFFAVYSYIATLVTNVAHAPEWVVPIVLVVMGLGMTFGNIAGGVLADRDLVRTLLYGTIAMIIVQLTLAAFAVWIVPQAVLVFAVGFVSSVLSPAIQTRLIRVAAENQSIASAMNHSALNIGNATGAALGGLVIAHGFGYAAPIWVGVALASAGLIVLLVSLELERRTAQRTAPAETVASA